MTHTLDRTARIRSAWQAAWDQGRVEALDELLSPGYVRRRGPAAAPQDREQFKDSVRAIREAFPDLHTEIEEIVEDGEELAIRWRSTGSHTGDFLGVPPTGRPVEVSGATFTHFDGGVIAEEWVTWDPRQLLEALGIITTTQEAAVDADLVRGVHRKFITGVTVVTTDDAGTPGGWPSTPSPASRWTRRWCWCACSAAPPPTPRCTGPTIWASTSSPRTSSTSPRSSRPSRTTSSPG